MEPKDFEEIRPELVNHQIRNKAYDNSRVYGYFNVDIDMTRFQKAHYEVDPQWLHETHNGKTTWYCAVLEAKLQVNGMSISLCTEMVKNEDGKKDYETGIEEEDKAEEKHKQDCEINAFKRLVVKLHKEYPRLKMRLVMDGLYACDTVFKLLKEYDWEYSIVLKDKKIPTVMEEYIALVGLERNNIVIEETREKKYIYQYVNGIDYKGTSLNILEQITYYKKTGEQTKWIWISSKEISNNNVTTIANEIGRKRSYIENQGFKEQKTNFDLEHVYSLNYIAMTIIYIIIQIAHMIMQVVEHSNITGDFKKEYKSAIDFGLDLLMELKLASFSDKEFEEVSCLKIQIRFI